MLIAKYFDEILYISLYKVITEGINICNLFEKKQFIITTSFILLLPALALIGTTFSMSSIVLIINFLICALHALAKNSFDRH